MAGSLLAALAGVVVAGCSPLLRQGASPLQPLAALPPVADDTDRASLLTAARESLRYFERLPVDRELAFGTAVRSAGEMRAAAASLVDLLASDPSPEVLAAELGRRFVAHRAEAPGGVVFTGYYLPELPARTARDQRHRVPVLGRPPDLVTVAPGDLGAPPACREQLVGRVVDGALKAYPARSEIETAGVMGAPVLAWVDDPVGLFFLQIQGSGILTFPDGTSRLVGFAASNGRPYVSIGRLLVERGALRLEHASMPAIRSWIEDHPEEGQRLLQENPRYVFFRELTGPPLGSLGVAVTPGRSIAIDPTVFPPGALGFIHIQANGPSPELSRLVFAQDAGAAIRGPGRVDVYFGAGTDAAKTAGSLRSPGELYFFLPRPTRPR